MEKSIDLASNRYNEIGMSLNLPIIDLCCTENKKQNVEFTINFVSKQKKQEIVSEKSKCLIGGNYYYVCTIRNWFKNIF